MFYWLNLHNLCICAFVFQIRNFQQVAPVDQATVMTFLLKNPDEKYIIMHYNYYINILR
jgi:hypothetical protein